MKTAYIYDAVRTPRGRAHKEKGALREIAPIDLLKVVLQNIQERNSLDTQLVEEVSIGCNTVTKEQGANIAKIGALYAGYAPNCNGVTLSSFCTSGLEAIQHAAMKIQTGAAKVAVAGGVESMTRVPMFSDKGAWFANPDVAKKTGFIHMGLAADLLANLNGIDSDAIINYSLRSHELANKAWEKEGYVAGISKVSAAQDFAKDELIRIGLSKEKFAHLPKVINTEEYAKAIQILQKQFQLAAFECRHSVGSAPGIADAASLLLLGDEDLGKQINQQPIAKIVGAASVGTNPVVMLQGVVDATQKLLQQTNLTTADIDLFEVNESFAAVPLYFAKQLNIGLDRLNVNGGAIAMGHPLGATGGILIGSLIAELQHQNKKRGIATICAGAGIAQATMVELV